MRVLFLASEMAPYSKTGGLGDVIGALPGQLRALGIETWILQPYYGQPQLGDLHYLGSFTPPYTDRQAELWSLAQDPHTLFVRAPELYERGGIYQNAHGEDWPDNALRFAYLNRMGVELAQGRIPFLPGRMDLVHAHDWQGALAPYLLALESRVGAARPATLLSIHNLAYQGRFSPNVRAALHLPAADFHPAGTELYGSFSFLKAGLVYADALSTVSPSYAQEIQSEAFGMGLDGLLRARSGVLTGILNGIDDARWNPSADPYLPAHYHVQDLRGKARCKAALQHQLGLYPDPEVFVLGMISRMVEQKGCDLVLDLAPELLRERIQLIFLGSGEAQYQDAARRLAQDFPRQAAAYIGFNESLAHRIEAGIDAFLMPSRFEPCGLNQMFSLRYGSPPIVHSTGGLADTVRDIDYDARGGNGFAFAPATREGLRDAIHRALRHYQHKDHWRELQRRGMTGDYGWRRAAQEYVALYHRILGGG
ncbi:glycogen synthase GlgA [Candidatus Igneacidithiobacillus taiwanensis]|uniref:glycogen synthase GlgA n=1 Tax=Candidatus Igneacidithiobacillus taiwanensis TaxID=1945924 RepID=UPI002898EC6C|nr:glycogen synthase GlgA [Candidatus Igneacidithiobacillus taiwanensis]